MASFNFIPPPGPFDQAHTVTHQIYYPDIAWSNQQHITVHQVHNPGAVIHHAGPPYPHPMPPPFIHEPLPPMYPQPLFIQPPMVHPGAMAMQNFAPGVLQQNLARQPLRLAHIVSYSKTLLASGDRVARTLYEQAMLATGLQPLLTFDVSHFPAPDPVLAAQFTGVSREIQDSVKQYEEGKRDVDGVVNLMMSVYDQGGQSLLLIVGSPGGAHRSVAIAEIIKKKLLRRGVTTVHLNHVHRRRLPGDPV